jgi:hypothetical protein
MTLVTERSSSSLERQQWLEAAVEALRARFAAAGYVIPQKVRVAIGWPKRAASCGAIGECWATAASSDQHAELFISPGLTEGARILDVLAHELVHATMGSGVGHGPPFKRCALAIGLVGPMRTTTAGPQFTIWAAALMQDIGRYPCGYLTDTPRQGTRMLRCQCLTCGYLARVSRRWLDQAGPPICPTDQIPLQTTGARDPRSPPSPCCRRLDRAADSKRGVHNVEWCRSCPTSRGRSPRRLSTVAINSHDNGVTP